MSLSTLQRVLADRPHHLSAFLMLGDPTPELSVDLAIAAVDAGATMLELGLPFSDPCADGPAIQASCQRARAAGVSTPEALAILAAIHRARPGVPLNLLVYGNLVHALGMAGFCDKVSAAGASTLLVPDIPLEESAPLREAVARNDLGHVSLVGPRTDDARLAELDAVSSGFLYLAGYQGVTGKDGASGPAEAPASLVRVAGRARLPVCLGFGICRGEQVAAAFAAGAAIVVVGSHLARAIGAATGTAAGAAIDRRAVLDSFGAALAPLLSAIPGPPPDHEPSPRHGQSPRHEGEARCS